MGSDTWKTEAEKEARVREGTENALLLALKAEEGSVSQGMQAASRHWKSKKQVLS